LTPVFLGKHEILKGRKPKPLGIREAEGDASKWGANKLRARIESQPKAARGLPICPRHLRGRARSAWNFWTAELESMGLDRRPDAMMLEGACVHYERAVKADLTIQKEGLIVTESVIGKTGEILVTKYRNHPAVAISNAAWRHLRAFCSEFGLSPVSRTRLSIEKKADDTDLLALLSKPRERKDVPVVVN
jgi:P27 family predicted phage terminase small subunit